MYQNSDFVVGCTVASNFCRQGGGLYGCTNVVDTEISYNKAKRGGGAYESILTGCTIAHNVADDFANGNYNGFGAGIAYGAATNCVFRDNSCSAAFGTKSLVGCDIADTSMHAYHIESCVIHNVKNAEMVRAVGNVAYPEGHVSSNIYMFGGVELMRNCLITNCTWWSIPGSYVNSSAFDPGGAENIAARIENCTFMDNNFYLLTRNFNKPTQTIAFINSVVHSTRPGDRPDIEVSAKCTVLTNCVYRTCSITQEEGFENAGCTEIENPADLKLLREGPHPYSIKRSSPLRGGGLPLDWMTDGVDIVGNPRLREGQVDIGAYQCWLDPDGTYLIVR